jgi:hypothetical protein
MTAIVTESPPAAAGHKMSSMLAGSLRREQAMQRLIQSGDLNPQDLATARQLLARRQALTRYIRTLNL